MREFVGGRTGGRTDEWERAARIFYSMEIGRPRELRSSEDFQVVQRPRRHRRSQSNTDLTPFDIVNNSVLHVRSVQNTKENNALRILTSQGRRDLYDPWVSGVQT